MNRSHRPADLFRRAPTSWEADHTSGHHPAVISPLHHDEVFVNGASRSFQRVLMVVGETAVALGAKRGIDECSGLRRCMF